MFYTYIYIYILFGTRVPRKSMRYFLPKSRFATSKNLNVPLRYSFGTSNALLDEQKFRLCPGVRWEAALRCVTVRRLTEEEYNSKLVMHCLMNKTFDFVQVLVGK